MEKWKILDFEEGYENYSVSDMGNIKNNITNKILKGDPSSEYIRYNLYNRKLKKQIKFSGHRLVALYFVDGDKSLIINHKDGNKQNNVAENLEWVTYSENLSHAFKTKLRSQDGTKNPSNIYDEDKIHSICKILEKDKNIPSREIVIKVFGNYDKKYMGLVYKIRKRIRWNSISKNYNF